MGRGTSDKSFAVILTLIIAFSSLALSGTGIAFAQQSPGDWPMFQANPSHTGVGTGSAVLASELLWKSNVAFSAPPSAIRYGIISTPNGWSSPAVVNGVVYACYGISFLTVNDYGNTGYSDVFALNATTGAVIWDYSAGSSAGGLSASPAVANGMVFFGFGNVVGALNATDGVSLWNFTVENGGSSPCVVGNIVYVGGYVPGNVYALNASTGVSIWNYTTGGGVGSSPAVVDGVVYVGSLDGNVYALNATSGAKIWSYLTSGIDNGITSSPAVANGVVYVGSFDNNIYALNAADGKKLWNYTTGGLVDSSPVVAGGVVYIGSGDGNFYALDAKNGAELWNFTSGVPIASSGAIVGGVVYVDQDYAGALYCLNASTGEKLSNYTISAGITSASPAVVNGVVYVGSANIGSGTAQVYALNGTIISSTHPNTLPIVIVGVVAVVIVVTAAVVLMFRKRLKTKLTSHIL